MREKSAIKNICVITLFLAFNAITVYSQSTNFTYQGRLNGNCSRL
jgi:hypothetical protein